MKTRSILAVSISALVCGATFAPRAEAVDLFWDSDGTTTAATGGTGTWNTSTALWRNGTSTGTLQNYDNTSPSSVIARFGGTAGIVTLSGTLNVGGLNFGVGGYTLTGGTLNIAPSTSPFTYTTNGGTTTIDSTITSAAGSQIVKTGAGTLQINTGGGGSGSSPVFYTVTGGTLNTSTGIFDSIIAMPAGNRLGVQAASPTTVLTLDAGTFQVTSAAGNALAVNRTVQVNAAGGSIADFGSNNFYEAQIINNAGASSSLYLSNISGTTQFRGAITGTGRVTWMGAGTASIQANNTYSGGTTISGGTMVAGARGLGSGAVTVNAAGTLSVSQSGNIGLAGQYFNAAPASANFTSQSTLQSHLAGLGQPALAVNTTSMNFGTSGGSFPSPYNSGGANFESYYSGMINIGTAGTYTFNTSSDDGSVLFVDGALVVDNNFFQGVTTRTGSIALTSGMHNIAYGYYQGTGGYGFSAQISGAGNTTMVDLTTANAQITPDLVIGSLAGAGNVALTTGNLILGQDNTNQTFSGIISGIGGVNKWGTGTQTFSGANTYSGTTTISGGILRLGASNVIPDGAGKGDVTVNGSLDLNGFADTINGLTGSGVVAAGSTQLTVGNNNANGTFSGVLTGSSGGGLVKTGSGTQTLSGAADNAGARAQVNAGTLVLGKTSSSGVHAVGSGGGTDYALVITGGTAKLGGTGGDEIYQNSAVNMTGGTFDLAGLSEGFDGLSGSGGTITNSTASTTSTLTLGQNNSSGSPVFAGVIQNGTGIVALTKTGTGIQTLTGNNTYIGRTSVNSGTLAITAGGISGGTDAQTIIVNDTGTGTAAMTQSGGTVSSGTGEIWIGQNSGSTGIYNLSGGNLNSSNWLAIGRNFATGTLNITSSGALSHTGAQHVTIGSGGGGAGNGTVNQTGGSFTASSEVWLGEGGTANYNISGGTVTFNGGLKISQSANPGTLTLQNATGTTGGLANGGGNEVFTTTTLLMSASTGASTVNLDGGTLVVTQIASAGGAGTKTFNFNGGTLKANTGASATFMTGLTNAFVKSASAVIDTNGQTITIAQPLLTDVSSTGGGLTKSGTGTLTLSGTNTYTGGTLLNGGTLAVANNSALGSGGALTMALGTTLANFDASAHTLTNNVAFNNTAGMTATFSTTSDLTLTGTLSGATNGILITKQGTGTLTIPDTAQTVGSAAAPAVWTVTGGGTLSLTRGNNLGTLPTNPTTQVILDNGTFRTNTAGGNFFSQRTMQINAAGGTWLDSGGGVNFDGTVANSGAFTINTPVSNATTLLNGAVSGSGSLIKSGAGALTLAAANTYTGVTTINAGTLTLTGSLANTAITVASGAFFSPTVTTSAGLGFGSAGASLTLNSGAIFDMTSASAGTINTLTLNPGSNTFSSQALNIAGANLRFDLGSSSADLLQVNSGTAAVSGVNNTRINTGSNLTTGTYTLISAASGLTGTLQFDGGSSLSVPAQQQIKNVGGTYYRLTLQNSTTAQQVVVSAAPSNIINIMPLGSSITEGVSSEPGGTYAGGGYRSQLYQSLVNDGRFTPHFVGSQTVLDAHSTTAYNVLSGANELSHEGHAGYTTSQVLKNLNANGGDGGNNGGFWLAPGNGKNPDYVTLSIGGNDYGANNAETTGPLNRTDAIVSQIVSLRPDAQIILSNLFYRTQNVGGVIVGDLQNTYYNPGVQGVVFNHVLAGQHVSFNDAYTAVTPGNNTNHIFDGIHTDTVGYQAFANSWYDVLANGAAYWTGASSGQWSAPTNFAQNYQLTTPRQGALGASTDVYFNSIANPLNTTLGGNLSVRSVNFADGADGSVTIGGANVLTLGAGGITVQAGTGAHTISPDVVLGADQTWGNVSSNPLVVSGAISGSRNLNIVGSYTVQLAGALSGGTYTTTTQTVSGTGAIVLSGANTYTGTTTISSGTLQIGNGGTTGSLSTSSAITNNGALVFNRTDTVTQGTHFSAAAIAGTGSLTQAGTGTLVLNTANSYTGTTAINAGVLATSNLQANGTASGIGQGSALTLNGGTMRYTGGSNANGFNRTITVGASGGTLDNFGGGFVSYGGALSGAGSLTFVDSSSSSHEWLVTGSSPGFSGNVFVGNGTAGSGLLQYRSSNANPFGAGVIQVNGGGVVSADNGTTTPSTLGNNFVLNGGLLATQGPNMTYTGTISLTASSTLGNVPAYSANGTLTLTNTISGGSAAALTIASLSSVTLTGNNTFTGATAINSGTLSAAAVGALGATSSVAVNSGGTLLLAGAGAINRVNDAAEVTLAGGTLSMAGLSSLSETLGALTLSGNSTIDFGTGNTNSLTFAGLFLGSFNLVITHWTGIIYAAGETTDHSNGSQDRLLFTANPSLTNSQLSQISFYDDSGIFIGTGNEIAFGGATEIVPVPEPSTLIAAIALLGLVGYRERRRLGRGFRRTYA